MNNMKTLLLRAALFVGLLGIGSPLLAQTSIDNTTLSANITATQTNVQIASVTCTSCSGPLSNYIIYLDNEAMCVTGAYVSGTTLPVTRGCLGTKPAAHTIKNQLVSGNTVVFFGPSVRFHQGAGPVPGAASGDPALGSCTRVSQQFMPWINISTGWVWTCDGSMWRATVNININGTSPSRATS